MKLVLTSDTHGFHRGWDLFYEGDLPDGDVLLHAGDFSRDHGSWLDAVRFIRWLGAQRHPYKLLCPGNHDYAFHEDFGRALYLCREHGVYLVGSKALNLGGLTFAGGPWMPVSGWDPAWGFELEEAEREERWAAIPSVDVLVTHVPPYGILDKTPKGEHLGCPSLRKHIFEKIKPRLHVFGHVHEGYGVHEENGTVFMNVASNTRGQYTRNASAKETTMTMGIRDPVVYEMGPNA